MAGRIARLPLERRRGGDQRPLFRSNPSGKQSTEMALQGQTRYFVTNFFLQDVLLASGAVHGKQGLGFECAGIVSRINTSTSISTSGIDLQVGDRVLCWSSGSLASHVRVDSMCCIKLPDSLSFNDAVTMPTAYATMIRGLLDNSSLATGDTVLIHSASSPMGLAGIQIARMQGAEVSIYNPNFIHSFVH